MVRAAPIPFLSIIQGLRILQRLIEEANPCNPTPPNAPHDGFPTPISAAIARLRSEHEPCHQITTTNFLTEMSSSNDNFAKSSVVKGKKRKLGLGKVESVIPSETQNRENKRTPKKVNPYSPPCIFCPRAKQGLQTNAGNTGKLMQVLNDHRNAEVRWAHEKCAMFSEDVYEVDGLVDNVDRVLCRTANTRCAFGECGETKPTIRCAHLECPHRYHFVCALSADCVCVEDGYRTYCPEHKSDAPHIDEAEFLKVLSCATEPSALRHDDVCYLCNTGGRLLMCDSCDRVTHPACAGLRSIPLEDWYCSVCAGTHHSGDVKPKFLDVATQTQTLQPRSTNGPAWVSTSYQTTGRDGKRTRGEGLEMFMSSSEFDGSLGARSGNGSKRGRVSDGGKRLVLCHTGLNDSQKELLHQVAKIRRMTLKDDIEERVTHMLVGCKRDGKPPRTMKLCKAVALKLPVVCWGWVQACADSVGEDTELPDMDAFLHTLTRKPSDAGVFEGMSFSFSCFSGDKQKREELAELVKMGGGSVLWRDLKGRGVTADTIFVQNEEVNKRRSRDSRSRFEPPAGASVVGRTWIFDKIMLRRDDSSP